MDSPIRTAQAHPLSTGTAQRDRDSLSGAAVWGQGGATGTE